MWGPSSDRRDVMLIGFLQQAKANVDTHQSSHPSHLFVLRVWSEELGDDRREWRGQVRHVTSGEVRYFRDWQTLVEYLKAVLASKEEAQEETPESRDAQNR